MNRVGERRVRGAVEGYYQAAARAYWLSPQLVGQIGGKEQAAQVHLPDSSRRAEFLADVRALFQGLAEKYGPEDGQAPGSGKTFRVVLVAYPRAAPAEAP